jgi:D-alanyl-D-alanine carboxypeptidase/D-alanyl-D-alanine-endopeptidase (penicillin-binding protein 4)
MRPRLVILLCLFSLSSAGAFAEDPWKAGFVAALKNGGAYAETEDGTVLLEHRSRDPFIPASTLKIATAACAIGRLGREHRFATDFFTTRDGRLVVKGYGDPFLVSEELEVAASELISKGVRNVTGIVLDTSYFAPDIQIDGTSNSANPYDALNGALLANFNTVNVHKMGSGPRAAVYSAETQTPITPIAVEAAGKLPAGQQRINIGQDPRKGARYVGELVAEFLKKKGASVSGPIEVGPTPPDAERVHRHLSSRRSEDVVRELLKFSTNFMANQVFLVLGAERFGAPATVEKAQTVLRDCLKNDAGWTNFHVHEGAGLSRKNSVTPRQMVELLRSFEPHLDLLPLEQGLFRAKTGTLTGVNTLAGFFRRKDGKVVRFAILVNSPVAFDYKFKLARMLYDGVNGP